MRVQAHTTEHERIQLDASTTTEISRFEEKRLKDIDLDDQRKKKIREDLTYLRTNKLQLLKSGVYSPELLLQEETSLNTELAALQEKEIISDLSMQAVIADILKLSELLKIGSAYYSFAKSPEKERIIKIIFSELLISETTLQFKCKNGFQALENRFLSVCDPTDWLSEAVRNHKWTKESVERLRQILNGSPTSGP